MTSEGKKMCYKSKREVGILLHGIIVRQGKVLSNLLYSSNFLMSSIIALKNTTRARKMNRPWKGSHDSVGVD